MVRLCPCLEVSVRWYLVVVLFSRDGPFVSPAWRFLLIGRRFLRGWSVCVPWLWESAHSVGVVLPGMGRFCALVGVSVISVGFHLDIVCSSLLGEDSFVPIVEVVLAFCQAVSSSTSSHAVVAVSSSTVVLILR